MRPKERLLSRDIPKDAIRKELEDWSDRLSSWNEFFTAIVVLGLVIEYFPGIARFLPASVFAVIQAHAEPLRELGGLLVIVGVAGELWIGFRSSKVETDLREETGKTISETNERAAKAGQAAAEANLARVQLEQQLAWREIPAKDRDAIAERLSSFAGQQIDVCTSTGNIESMTFAGHIVGTLRQAGWNAKQMVPGSLDVGGYGNTFSYSATSDEKSRAAISALLRALSPFAGAGTSSGVVGHLGPPPRIHLEVHDKVPLIRKPPGAG